MIGKILHNQDFGSTCRYVARGGAVLLGGNMLGRTAAEISDEFRMLQSLRPDLKKPVVHLVGAFAPNDCLNDAEMLEIASKFLVGLGYEDSLHTIWRHMDGTTAHFHIIAGQMDIDGMAISQSFERFKSKRLCRGLEKEFCLQEVPNIRQERPEPDVPLPPCPEPDGLDVEIPSVTTVVSDFFSRVIRAALPSCTTVGDLAVVLRQHGITMVPQIHAENGQVYGMGYRVETGPMAGAFLTGSKIPGNFSPKKLVAKHGLDFCPDRDLPILRNAPPPPPLSTTTQQKPPKPRRKKKGDRHNARHQRKSRFQPSSSYPNPWLSIGTTPEILSAHGPSPAGTQLVREILANPYNRASSVKPAHEPLFPYSSANPWGLASHH